MTTRADQLKTFIGRTNGREIVTPCTGHPAWDAQCKDLVDAWSRFLGKHCFTGNAVALKPTRAGEWKWVPNSPSGIPPVGAVVVVSHWSRGSDGRWYNFGHTMIAMPRCTTHTIYSFDQNWSSPHHARPETHVGYNVTNWRVLGWWIPL